MGKKKPFIDKKKSSTYHVLHRSQRDVSQHLLNEGDTDAAGFILWPSSENNPQTDKAVLGGTAGSGNVQDERMQEWRDKLKETGLLDDSNERDRYMKEITGAGTFLAAGGGVGDAFMNPILSADTAADADMLEVKDQLENIPLREALDEDIAAILYGDSEDVDFDEFEDLNDEFVLDAATEVKGEDDGDFDYDTHIQKLMDKARQERDANNGVSLSSRAGHEWALNDQNFFSKANALHENENEDDDSFAHIDTRLYDEEIEGDLGMSAAPGAVQKLTPEEEKALCEKFEQTLLEYDSDEIGDNPEEEIEGRLPLEGDNQVEAALDDFLQEKEDEIFMQGRTNITDSSGDGKHGGSGFSALVGTKMVPVKDIVEEEPGKSTVEPISEVLSKAKERLAEPPLQPPAEEILIDGQSYFSERVRNPWDCESILSTYSNLDNNPVTIQGSGRKRGKKKNRDKPHTEEESEQIKLSAKTGLPVGVFSSPNDGSDDDYDDYTATTMSVNKGEARKRQETPAEKRARKAAIKRERQMNRIQKKVTRQVYQEEFSKQAINVGGDAVAGKPVFRYS